MFKFLRLIALSVLVFTASCSKSENEVALSDLQIITPEGAVRAAYKVETADTKEKMYNGLMGRTSLDINSGLVFDINILPQDMEVALWMKDTLIPLDIVFVDENGVVFSYYENARPNDVTPIYPPKRPRLVLEINGGQIAQYGISIGDKFKFDLLDKK
ncbi:MAG: DUF192 domain-containing protein [Alphaproteobacteria bacterium]|nr:DUF192 domain-containing protein [Alphaproteobacteria bacterium]